MHSICKGFSQQSGRRANAETAVKVAGATADCIVLHGKSNFLGFSLWATPKHKLVVIANQASKNVSDLVLPAPKTPAMANVDRPDWRAETMESAMERI